MPIEERSSKPKKITLPRPGHADLAGVQKFDFDDIRNVLERSSARETAMRVALASVCRKLLEETGIEVGSRVIQIHTVKDNTPIYEIRDTSKGSRIVNINLFDAKQLYRSWKNFLASGRTSWDLGITFQDTGTTL